MRRARSPVGWQSISLRLPHSTTVCARLSTVVICKEPGHFTSMKKLLGEWTIRFNLILVFSSFGSGFKKPISMFRHCSRAQRLHNRTLTGSSLAGLAKMATDLFVCPAEASLLQAVVSAIPGFGATLQVACFSGCRGPQRPGRAMGAPCRRDLSSSESAPEDPVSQRVGRMERGSLPFHNSAVQTLPCVPQSPIGGQRPEACRCEAGPDELRPKSGGHRLTSPQVRSGPGRLSPLPRAKVGTHTRPRSQRWIPAPDPAQSHAPESISTHARTLLPRTGAAQ